MIFMLCGFVAEMSVVNSQSQPTVSLNSQSQPTVSKLLYFRLKLGFENLS